MLPSPTMPTALSLMGLFISIPIPLLCYFVCISKICYCNFYDHESSAHLPDFAPFWEMIVTHANYTCKYILWWACIIVIICIKLFHVTFYWLFFRTLTSLYLKLIEISAKGKLYLGGNVCMKREREARRTNRKYEIWFYRSDRNKLVIITRNLWPQRTYVRAGNEKFRHVKIQVWDQNEEEKLIEIMSSEKNGDQTWFQKCSGGYVDLMYENCIEYLSR